MVRILVSLNYEILLFKKSFFLNTFKKFNSNLTGYAKKTYQL